jgi:PhnB protein
MNQCLTCRNYVDINVFVKRRDGASGERSIKSKINPSLTLKSCCSQTACDSVERKSDADIVNNQPREDDMPVTPYLFLNGRCEEAIEFYKKTLGAEVTMMMRFKEAPAEGYKPTPDTENKIMHAYITVNGAPVMLSDGRCSGETSFQGFALALDANSAADGERMFNALAQGGQVHQPLIETFFAKSFGMVADKFGVGWMITAGPKNP